VLWTKYRMPIIVGLLAIIIGFAGFGAYRFMSARRDAAAASLLGQAKDIAGYRKVIDEYPNSGAAASAYLLLAAEQRKAQQFAEANTTLQAFISKHPKHELVTTAKMAMAGNVDALGRTDEALEMYRRVAVEHPKSFNAPLALLAQAQLLKQKGQIDQARQACETVMTQYRDGYAAQQATQFLKTLKPAAPAAANAAVPSVPPAESAGNVPTPASEPAATP
jgi:TolA-binding protein